MSGRGVRGVDRVRTKLDAALNAENYYEAHQMYRTLYFRYLGQKKYDELLELLQRGADVLLEHNQQSSGADLGILFVDVLKKASILPEETRFLVIANLFTRMKADLPEREVFLREALAWSSTGPDAHASGHPALHKLFALTFWKEKNYPMARHHFLHSTDGHGCANMLIELHLVQGYSNEVDLFIAQAVLQCLCLRNRNTATVAFNSYTKHHPNIGTGPPYLLPLLNFIWFLLKAIESGKYSVFLVLCERYQPSITRDPAYSEYLAKIACIFFGVAPAKRREPGLFGNFFQSLGTLFNDDSDSEEAGGAAASSSTSSSTRGRPSTHHMETEDVD